MPLQRPLVLYGLAPLLALPLLLAGCNGPEADTAPVADPLPRPAKIVPVQPSGIAAVRTYPGTIEARNKADLSFRVQGQLVELPAEPGQRVRRGDLLARLDPAVFDNALAEREAQLALAQVRYDQARTLQAKKLASQIELDEARAELDVARALRNAARDQVAYTRLTAPFDGMVTRVDAENHQTVQARAPVLQLQDNDQLEVHFSVPESLISQLIRIRDPNDLGDYSGEVRFASHPGETFRACHKEFQAVPDPLTRTYPVVFALDPIEAFSVLPGMTVSIELDFSRFLRAEARSGLSIPVEALFEDDGRTWVWRVDEDMRAHRTPVVPARLEADRLLIAEGLSADDRVIAAGVGFVREGMEVRPFVKERGL